MKITVLGIIAFIALIGAFFVWFGGPPEVPDGVAVSRRGFGRAWLYCTMLFITGAGTACFGDFEYGMFPPTSLRWLFVLSGGAVMAASALWMHSLTEALKSQTIRSEASRSPVDRSLLLFSRTANCSSPCLAPGS
jgi:hypothetical protein